jgi:SAM-dependent methyltransferase
MEAEAGFASIFDALYADAAGLNAQLAFLEDAFACPAGLLLDAGCGTGRYLIPLCRRGYRVVGVDLSPAMLAVACGRLADGGLRAALLRGDLRALPFGPAFAGVLCLDSPLALILEEAGLAAALTSFHRALQPGGVLVAEVYDYVKSLGEEDRAPWTGRFPAPWGHIIVHESHRYDCDASLWEMTQAFVVQRNRRQETFTITHRLRTRTADAYAAAIERAGFRIQALWTAYPGADAESSGEHRMIFCARRS